MIAGYERGQTDRQKEAQNDDDEYEIFIAQILDGWIARAFFSLPLLSSSAVLFPFNYAYFLFCFVFDDSIVIT